MTETNRIEFKERLTRDLDIEKEVVAFLNYHEGGILYIGIDKNGNAIGVEDVDGDMLRIKDRIRNNIMPSPMGLFDVTIEQMDGKSVIKVFMASGSEKPYYKTAFGMSTKGCYLRVGTAAEPMPQLMIEDLFASRVRNSLKNIISPRQDLTFQQLHIYYQSKGLTLNDNFLRTLELLTPEGQLNYVAYLLADENGNSIKLARYHGTDRDELISNMEFGYCSILKATDQVLNRLQVENQVKTKLGYPFREDTTQWNERAVRELVINAIVHNDYTNEVPPKFELFSDRMEITSAGRLPFNMSQEEFFSGVSNPRNKELMRVCRDVEIVEALGSGMPRVLKVYDRTNFFFMDNFIRIVIPYTWSANGVKDGAKQLSENQKTIYNYLLSVGIKDGVKDGVLISTETTATISANLHIAFRTVQRVLSELQTLQLVQRMGGRKGGYWEVKDT